MLYRYPINATGVRGVIRWGYYPAADVVAFTVHRAREGDWSVSATITNSDAFKLAQRGLMFVVPSKFGAWQWPITAIVRRDGPALVAALGEPTRGIAATVPSAAPAPLRPVSVYDAYGRGYATYQTVEGSH